jgi:hypothetical protein
LDHPGCHQPQSLEGSQCNQQFFTLFSLPPPPPPPPSLSELLGFRKGTSDLLEVETHLILTENSIQLNKLLDLKRGDLLKRFVKRS